MLMFSTFSVQVAWCGAGAVQVTLWEPVTRHHVPLIM